MIRDDHWWVPLLIVIGSIMLAIFLLVLMFVLEVLRWTR